MSKNIIVPLGTTGQNMHNLQAESTHKNSKEGNLFIKAGDFFANAKSNDRIEQNKAFAKKQAMKLISDAWARDNEVGDSIKSMQANKKGMLEAIKDNNEQIKQFDEQKAALKEQFAIEDDSQEQKDLKLLEKYQSYMNGARFDSFSEEEFKRLQELQGTERTQYQKSALEINAMQDKLRKEVNALEYGIEAVSQGITWTEIENLKNQNMVRAQKASDVIMDASGKATVAMLIEDAKEKIDEETKKTEEMAKEEMKKKDDSDSAIAEAQKNITKVLKENNLIDEDIKGLIIDLGF